MLSEHFVASISPTSASSQAKVSHASIAKDAGIFVHEFQPLAAQRSTFKKSATPQNCLAVSVSHIFAAQAEKAVVHVYNREKGNQEATVPFPERIHSIALACEDTVLALGTEGGRIFLWETCTGRLVNTSQAHLQPVTVLTVDPTSNFLVSGSADSNIHVWSLTALLSFSLPSDDHFPNDSRSPIRTLSNHHGPITALSVGHSSSAANIAVSASRDKTAIVWDFRNGTMLRTYLLGSEPLALALDPADRAFYVAYDDGTVQLIDFFAPSQASAINALHDTSSNRAPVQPPPESRWTAVSQNLGAGLSLAVSWDGTTLLSGHTSGKIASWADSRFTSTIADLPGPVANLVFLPPTGFPGSREPKFKVHAVVKPRIDVSSSTFDRQTGVVPGSYTFAAQLTGNLPSSQLLATIAAPQKAAKTPFEEALEHPSFPVSLLEEGLAELAAWHNPPATPSNNTSHHSHAAEAADYMSLDAPSPSATSPARTDKPPTPHLSLEQQNELLRQQVASLRRVQKVTFAQLGELRAERKGLLEAQTRADRRVVRRKKREARRAWGVWGVEGDLGEGLGMEEESEDGSSGEENEEDDRTEGAESAASGEDEDESASD